MKKQGDFNPNCLFCQWIEADKALETHGAVAAFNFGFPVTEGHLLIEPLRHIADAFSMTEGEICDSEAFIGILSEKIGTSDPTISGFNKGGKPDADEY